MAKFALVSDVHLADHPPSSCTETYSADVLQLLHRSVQLANSTGAAALIIAGDLFHIKAPSRTSHKLVVAVMTVLSEAKCKVYVVPGNHDMQHDRLDSLERQPLGVLAESGVVELLMGWGEWPVYGVPWLQTWDEEHVSAALGEYREQLFERGTGTVKPLVVTHAPLYPPGKELPYEFFPVDLFAAMMGAAGHVFYGHVHEPHGVYSAGGVTFCNNGALSRGSLHEYNMNRQVGATVWDSQAGTFSFVPLPHRPASEVFRLAEHQQQAEVQGRLDSFLSTIQATDLSVVSIEAVLAHIKANVSCGQGDLALIEELLEEAGHG